MEASVDWLRAKGLAAAAKKAGRTAAEGLVGVAVDGTRGAVVEVNSETDFVAKNEQFQDFVRNVSSLALETDGDVDALKTAAYPGGGTVEEKLTDNIATIGENQSLRRTAVLEVGEGAVVSYVHNAVAPGMGKIGVLVALESAAPAETLQALGKQIAMHIAAANPLALDAEGLDPALVERERAIATEKAKESGKPANIVEKMVEGAHRQVPQGKCAAEPAVRHGQQDPGRRGRRPDGQGSRFADHAARRSSASSSARASRRPKATSPPKSRRPPASRRTSRSPDDILPASGARGGNRRRRGGVIGKRLLSLHHAGMARHALRQGSVGRGAGAP